MGNNITKNNHYVPQFYLRNWSADGKTIRAYRTLVPDSKVHPWISMSIEHVASHQHLYTIEVDGEPSDYYEKWFNSAFETPAQSAIEKVVAGAHLDRNDYDLLLQFLAVQMVRTPKWHEFIRNQIARDFPQTLAGVVEDLKKKLRNKKTLPTISAPKEPERFQVHAHVTPGTTTGTSYVKAEIFIGQKMWLSEVQAGLPKIISVLKQHSWCILEAPPGVDFPTSDDPVVRMGYRSRDDYWFKGVGIGQKNADIFMPLSPKHILFTEVGRKNKSRQIDTVFGRLLFEAIIRHASRYVFTSSDIKGMHALNPRKVDPVLFKAEQDAWDNWHQSQRDAEREWDSANNLT